MNIAIETTDLSKHFIQRTFRGAEKTIKAVQEINLQIREGELFGLVGPNQAGKTTLIKLLCTLILPTRGRALIRGFDTSSQEDKVKSSIGLVAGDERSFYWRLTGRQNLDFFASLYGLSPVMAKKKINTLLHLLEIEDEADTGFQNYSSGIKQRLMIARSLLNDPPILFMDEATKSIDPQAAHRLRRFIKEELVKKRNKTVVITTHQMHEAEEICDRVAVMDNGRIKNVGTIDELGEQTGAKGAGLDKIFQRVINGDSPVMEQINVSL